MPWSDDARVMVHPFRTYADLAITPAERAGRALAVRVAFVLLVIGGFVSLNASGRLVAFHVASTMLFWSFVPLVQAAVFVAVHALLAQGSTVPRVEALALYFTGHGPWLLFLLLLDGICLAAPDVYGTLGWLMERRILPLAMLGAIVWCGLLTYACFRAGLGLAKGRARVATALFYFGFAGVIVGYYLAMNSIQPQVPWAP